MTQEELKSLQINDTVYTTNGQLGNHFYGSNKKVVSIGSKYITLSDRTKWDKNTGRQVTQYAAGTMYGCEMDYKEEVKENQLRQKFAEFMRDYSFMRNITIDQIKETAKILKIDL